MNEFTKEELFMLLEETEGGIYVELRKKIQSMIDNYCEHEWINATYCEKCNKGILNDNQ